MAAGTPKPDAAVWLSGGAGRKLRAPRPASHELVALLQPGMAAAFDLCLTPSMSPF
jgi:hypothetical protein